MFGRRQRKFPLMIETPLLGLFRFQEVRIRGRVCGRSYSRSEPVAVACQRVAAAPEGVRVVVWPPSVGIRDVAEFVAALDARWLAITSRLDQVLDDAVPVIDAAVAEFWQIPDETAPSATELLRNGLLTTILFSPMGGEHRVDVYDGGDLIGSHDLLISLDDQLRPDGASFDG